MEVGVRVRIWVDGQKGPAWFKLAIVTVIEIVVAAGEVLRTSKENVSANRKG